MRFDIPSQSLGAALTAFARQSGLQLVYFSELVQGRQGPAVNGAYAPDAALALLLSGSRLTYAFLDDVTVVIEPATDVVAPTVSGEVHVRSEPPFPATQTAETLQPRILEEIIVTARRREENLQEVPVSVTALGTDQLELRAIENTEALNRQVPGLAVAGAGFFGRQSGVFRVRGIPGVAVYVDGVVHSGSFGSLQNIIELERIEVLRGPQGTLFGKNAVGGAIQYVSQRPGRQFGGRVRATTGSYNRTDVTANIDLPISDTVLTKVTAAKLDRDGYLPSSTVDRTYGSQDDTLGRLVLGWDPDGPWDATLFADYSDQRSNGNPSTVWALNSVCAGDQLPKNYLGAVPNLLCIYEALGFEIPQTWVYGAREERRTASNYDGPDLFTTGQGVKFELRHQAARGWSWLTLAGYRDVRSTGYADFDGTPLKVFDGLNYSEREERSVELQALYTGERWRGTTGLYYYNDRTRGRRMNWIANELSLAVNPGLYAAARAYYPDFDTGDNAGSSVVNGLTHGQSEGWALFAEWTYPVTANLSLTAGARYNHDDISTAAYPTVDELPALCCVPSLDVDAAGPAIPNQSGGATFTAFSPRLSIQYQWQTGVMTYFTYAEGFGAGGFTGGNIPNQVNGGFRAYGPELLANFELGLRADLLGGRLRLNTAVFHGRYHDIQVSEEVIPRFPTTTNAGAGRIRGFEAEGLWSPAPQLAFNYSFAWLDTAYTDLGRVTNIRLDSDFAYAPEFAYGLGATFVLPTPSGTWTFRADYGWQDAMLATLDVNTGSSIPAYGLLGARIGYRPRDAAWEIAAFGSNLSNEYYRISGFFIPTDQLDTGTVGRPREWGLTLSFRFD